MDRFGRRKVLWLMAGLTLVGAAIAAGYFRWWVRTPQPEASTHQIAAGGFARALVTSKSTGIRGRSHRPPHHLEFASSAGAVDVCVVPCTIGYRAEQWDYVNKVTDEFASGRVPQDVAAQASGNRGRIELKDLWRRDGRASYAVLVRSANESEVTLVVHYGP
jgi:hypothetical protein